MKDEPAITCKKCGTKHYMTADGMGHVMPVFCCGEELRKTGKKITSGKTSTKAITKKK